MQFPLKQFLLWSIQWKGENNMNFIETSALDSVNITNAFKDLIIGIIFYFFNIISFKRNFC